MSDQIRCMHGVLQSRECALCDLIVEKEVERLNKLAHPHVEVKGSNWFWLFVICSCWLILAIWYIREHP